MDTNVIHLAEYRASTQALPKRGVRLLVISKTGSLSVSLAPQVRCIPTTRSAEHAPA